MESMVKEARWPDVGPEGIKFWVWVPFVAIYFGTNDVEAKRLYYGVLTLSKTHE